MPIRLLRLLPLAAALFAPPAFAARLDSGDTTWIMASSALVLLMALPGLALFYSGLVRFKNVISVVTKTFALTALMSLLWLGLGYSLSFSGGGDYIGDLDWFLLRGIDRQTQAGAIPETVFAIFQMTFAIIAVAMIIGAYVERIRFSAVMVFSSAWLLVVYAPVTHWVWGGGFLTKEGIFDFAGGLVVHATSGITAIILAKHLGIRNHREALVMGCRLGNSSPLLSAVGLALIWVGWFGFNGGSAFAADGYAGMAVLVTHIAACAGTLVWVILDRVKSGRFSLVAAITGAAAGLSTITPASGFVSVEGGIALGVIGGALSYYAVPLIHLKFKIDDSLDVFAVSGLGGIVGALLVAFLAHEDFGGLGLSADIWTQFAVQAKGSAIVVAWTAGVSWLLAVAVNKVLPMRVSLENETEGLDESYHGERSFNW